MYLKSPDSIAALTMANTAAGDLCLTNVLSQSKSPYVRAHMYNPVAWQIWSPEAIALGRKHNRLLFVSIGYAACHWCHVMEHESFENTQIADILNKFFIPIKVDREERPDVDRQYMNYMQAASGRGGWPLNVFVTPDLEPIFAGTYFPGPETKIAKETPHMSFASILERIATVWDSQRERCLLSAKNISCQLREFAQEGSLGATHGLTRGAGELPDLELLEEAYEHFALKFDPVHGGFGEAPKFPTPTNLSFLLSLNHYRDTVKDIMSESDRLHAQNMALKTLRAMVRGGIHDHVGRGFARYSVTKDWSLPHFEKMLYDQSQLLNVYLTSFLITGDAEMLGAVYDISSYLTTEPIAAGHGGFCSSEDADSLRRAGDIKKREGAFYVWSLDEFRHVVGFEAAEVCVKFWNVKLSGNISPEHDAHNELANQNVLAISTSPDALAIEMGISKDQVVKYLKDAKAKLLEYRSRERPRPDLDDKIVVSWNGLTVSALARTSSVLATIDAEKCKECLNKAMDTVDFIRNHLFDRASSSLWRVYREGPGDTQGFADDYAFLIQGLIDLYEATFDDRYIKFADDLQMTQNRLFWDDEYGGFFSTQADQSDMILRLKDSMDNAEPSTNGVSASNLYRLGSILNDESYTSKARSIIVDTFSAEITQHPFLFTSMLGTLVNTHKGMRNVVICGAGDEVDHAISRSRSRWRLQTTIVRLGGAAHDDWIVHRNPSLNIMDKTIPRIQICEHGSCYEEVDIRKIESALRHIG